ncbi:MAG: hypothetical protein AB7U29_18455 [Desulfobulbus sp.]
MKVYSAILFIASFLLVFSLLFGIYGCTPPSEVPFHKQQQIDPGFRYFPKITAIYHDNMKSADKAQV